MPKLWLTAAIFQQTVINQTSAFLLIELHFFLLKMRSPDIGLQ